MLELIGLKIGYSSKKGDKVVLDSINAQLEKGSFTCFLGRNGAGKSTLLKTILGIIPPLSGSIKLDGKDLQKYHAVDRAKLISAVLTDFIRIEHLKVYDFVALGRTPYTNWSGKLSVEDESLIENALEITEISHLRENKISELSDGQVQVVSIARAICQDTDLILLDEPTAHLDVPNKFKVFEILRKLSIDHKKSIFVITHDMDLAFQNANNLWVVDKNKNLMSDLTEDLMLRTDLLDFFQSDKFKFDYESGKFTYHRNSRVELELCGGEEAVYWTKQALLKNGYAVSKKSEYRIDISPNLNSDLPTNVNSYKWSLSETNSEKVEFETDNIKLLICELNAYFFPEFNI
jgi:iron complex transport system ATP-binding protein